MRENYEKKKRLFNVLKKQTQKNAAVNDQGRH